MTNIGTKYIYLMLIAKTEDDYVQVARFLTTIRAEEWPEIFNYMKSINKSREKV